jgi:mannose-6-phosphate isomerase-like protein (cupin superfamily)
MPVVTNSSRKILNIPGLRHQTLAGGSDGLKVLEVWQQMITPGSWTPVHYHECEEVVVVLHGSGHITIAGERIDFGSGTTLTVPPKVIHQIVNSGSENVLLIAVLSETPARVFGQDGNLIALPWQEPLS